ncbi:MAG: phosphatidylethanolamine-binding protein [Candidatus Saccharibacteria bacterium]|nr:phosphatidylethanolamine-binding protein [Candidatus Saccharibacteria bacterium]
MTITSTAFQHNGYIPRKYTCDDANINPPLTFSEIPEDARSLVLIMDDPDAPSGQFTHWLLYDISPATLQIAENAAPETGTIGMNDYGNIGYGGPCPPQGTHRYVFKLYALQSVLNLPEAASRQEIETTTQGQVIETTELIGLYQRSSK